jgi:hypothetical protein
MPWMREMWLLEEQMKEKRHSSGSCLSMRAPTKNGLTSRNRASRAQKSAYSSAWKASFLRRQRVRGERERERERGRERVRERERVLQVEDVPTPVGRRRPVLDGGAAHHQQRRRTLQRGGERKVVGECGAMVGGRQRVGVVHAVLHVEGSLPQRHHPPPHHARVLRVTRLAPPARAG